MNVSCVYKYEHRKLLLESIWSKSMDELDIVVEELRLKHESAIKGLKEGEHG